jgi:hypothetical protein
MATVYPGYRSTPTTSNITLGSHGAGTSTVSITGGSGAGVLAAGTSANWANNSKISMKGILTLEGDEPDIMIGGKSMVKWMQKVEQRLSILEPKPEYLAKYEALQQAFDHYKTLEAILYDSADKE